MQSQSYRHITIMYSLQQLYHLEVDKTHEIYLGQYKPHPIHIENVLIYH